MTYPPPNPHILYICFFLVYKILWFKNTHGLRGMGEKAREKYILCSSITNNNGILYVFELPLIDMYLMAGCYAHWSQWKSFIELGELAFKEILKLL